MARVSWSSEAIDNLERICDYIEQERPSSAGPLVRRIFAACRRLEDFPRSGRVVPEDRNYREVIVATYRVMYRVLDENDVWITNVFGRGIDVAARRPFERET